MKYDCTLNNESFGLINRLMHFVRCLYHLKRNSSDKKKVKFDFLRWLFEVNMELSHLWPQNWIIKLCKGCRKKHKKVGALQRRFAIKVHSQATRDGVGANIHLRVLILKIFYPLTRCNKQYGIFILTMIRSIAHISFFFCFVVSRTF